MHVPPGAEKFTFPHPQPVSPPITPASSQSRQSSISQVSPISLKRYGFIGDSPPEHIDPTGTGYHFSYTPPQRDRSSDSSSESDDIINSDGEDSEPEVESYSEAAASVRQTPVRVLAVDDETDFTVEEMSENDMGYDSDTKPVQPDHIEDAESVKGNQDGPEIDKIAQGFKKLNCDNSSEPKDFEEVRQRRLHQRRKRWSQGGNHKRNHDESIGSGTDGDDIEPLDAHQVGSSARRLRRRTQGPEDKPRMSLLFDDPPAEIEELKHFDDDQDETSPITSHRSERSNNVHNGDDHDEGKYFMETTVDSADEEEVQEDASQYWEIESDPSSPSSSSCAAKAPRAPTRVTPQMSTTSSSTSLSQQRYRTRQAS